MPVSAFKPTNEALAFITLYKAMPPEIKEEVKQMIVNETDDELLMFTDVSLQTWDSENSDIEEESKVWEKFFQDHQDV